MNIYYDDEGYFLEITNGDISNCYFDNLGNGLFQIIDKSTGDIKGFAIFSFKARARNLDQIKVKVPFRLMKVD